MLPNQTIRGGILYETIYGVECRTPPIPKDLTKVRNYGLPKKEQIYRKVHLEVPDFMREIEQEFDSKGVPVRNIYTQQQMEYIDSELDKIYGKEDDPECIGDWIYIGGNLTWICPWQYLALEYWEITKANTPDKRAEYRDAQRRDILYYWNTFRHDPHCLGVIKMKNRQDLATTLAQIMTFWFATRKPDQVCGQMADKDENASANFKELLLKPFKRLPDWLIPLHTSSTTSEVLAMSEPPQRTSANNRLVRKSNALNSVCNTRAGSVKGYDSQRPDFLFIDEAGKMERYSIYTMLTNQKPFLQRGFVRSGWSAVFTTVNEMNKGGSEFQRVWRNSNPLELGKNHQTKSGWKRIYRPSDDGLEGFIGRYGESIRDKPNNDQWEYLQSLPLRGEDGTPITRERIGAREFIERNRAELLGDEAEYWTYVRNYSLNEDECFTAQNVNCHFSLTTLNNQNRAIDSCESGLWQRGNFRFRDAEKMVVVFEPDDNGRFWISWMPPTTELQNMVRRSANGIEPLNKRLGVIGVDPFSKSGIEGSMGAAVGKLFFDYATESANLKHREVHGTDMPGYYPTPGVFLMYHARPQSLTTFHEDILMACHFYGMQMAFESNVDKIEGHFRGRGYADFILSKGELKKSLPTVQDYQQSGIPMTADLKQHGVDCMEMFFAGDGLFLREMKYKLWEDVRRYPFKAMVQDNIDFKMDRSQIYDLTMACIICHVAEWAICDFSNPNFAVGSSDAKDILPDFLIDEMGWDTLF
jgi:hypothetical protein